MEPVPHDEIEDAALMNADGGENVMFVPNNNNENIGLEAPMQAIIERDEEARDNDNDNASPRVQAVLLPFVIAALRAALAENAFVRAEIATIHAMIAEMNQAREALEVAIQRANLLVADEGAQPADEAAELQADVDGAN